jgi:hypothetical protein
LGLSLQALWPAPLRMRSSLKRGECDRSGTRSVRRRRASCCFVPTKWTFDDKPWYLQHLDFSVVACKVFHRTDVKVLTSAINLHPFCV